MNRSKQNLYLFFEENESYWDVINSNLVSIYMNRYVIDEENQNEITGVYKLMKVPSEATRTSERIDTFFWPTWYDEKFCTEKGYFDNHLIDCAYNDAKQQVNTTHFIIGTRFMYDIFREPNYWFEEWIYNKFKSHFTESSSTCDWPLVITLLQGKKARITTTDVVEDAYFIEDKHFIIDVNLDITFTYLLGKRRRTHKDWPYHISVHDDLEDQTDLFHGRDKADFTHEWPENISFEHRKLFLCSMVTDSEEAELVLTPRNANSRRFWNKRPFQWLPLADGDPCHLYHFYECERLTMIVFPD